MRVFRTILWLGLLIVAPPALLAAEEPRGERVIAEVEGLR
jgi:hypothetical protein